MSPTIESMGSIGSSAAVRYATAADASELSRLGAQTFRATYAETNAPHLVDAYIADHYSTAIQLAELQNDRLTYLVAEIDAQLGGFALLRTDQSHPDVEAAHSIRLARSMWTRPISAPALAPDSWKAASKKA